MPPIRQFNRVHKSKVYWEPPPSTCRLPTRKQQQSAFTIYTNFFKDLDMHFSEDSSMQLFEELSMHVIMNFSEDLDMQFSEDSDSESENLDLKSAEDSDTSLEDYSYQSQFLSKDRAGRFQNFSESAKSVKLFQLFFTVKEIKNIVKQTNQQAAYIDFKSSWKPLTVTEAYRYLGCLIYIGIQPLRELNDHWGQLKSPIASCFSRRRFKQIQRAFTIQDIYTSLEQSGDSWWFRVEPLATTIRNACQKYWAPGAHVAVDECMIPYFGHTRHAIKAPHKPIKQGYKLWALEDCGYIFNWL